MYDLVETDVLSLYLYRYLTSMTPIPTAMRHCSREARSEQCLASEMPIRYRSDTDDVPIARSAKRTFFRLYDTDEIPMRYPSREARSDKFLYYLREPPAEATNFYTTSASLPPTRPILLLTEQY